MKEIKNAHRHYWDMTDEVRMQKLAKARARYGKPFVIEVQVPRSTEPSFVLREIIRRSDEAMTQKAMASTAANIDFPSAVAQVSPRVRGYSAIGQSLKEELRRTTDGGEKEGKKFVVLDAIRCA